MAYSAEIQSELDAHLLAWQDVSTRKMFGAMVYLVGSRMFAFIYNDRLVVKLPKEEVAEATESGNARPFIHGDSGRFGDWIEFPLASPGEVENVLNPVGKSYQYVQVAPKARKGRSRKRG